MIHNADATLCIAEGDELFAEEEKAHRCAVRHKLRRFRAAFSLAARVRFLRPE
jgi:hypothetical protein